MNELKKENTESIVDEVNEDNFKEKMIELISPYHVSDNMYELESASADLTALPSYHYKFKKNYLADYIIRPNSIEQLSVLFKVCRKLKYPITIRSAGTSCFSSSTPTKGGVIVDMRRLNKVYEIDAESKTVRCGTGISWLNLIEALTDYGLAPKSYPTSFKTSCVGGFIATTGKAGIGVSKYGSMEDTILSLVLVKPDGGIVEIKKGEDNDIKIRDLTGSYGIYGAIAEVELSVTDLHTSLEVSGYGFESYKKALGYYNDLINDLDNPPFFLTISDQKFEKYSHVDYPKQEWLVWANFYDEPNITSKNKQKAKELAQKYNGKKIEESYLKEKWRDINDAEVAIGRTSKNLIFQEYWVSNDTLDDFLNEYIKESSKYDFLTAIYIIYGSNRHSRIKIFGLSDINKPREFFGVKAFLHDRSVNAFKRGDMLYTVGVVNTFYLHKFRKFEIEKKRKLKERLDSGYLMNSMRFFNPTMKFWRVNLLFKTAMFLYKLF
jgi:hypothetical protein